MCRGEGGKLASLWDQWELRREFLEPRSGTGEHINAQETVGLEVRLGELQGRLNRKPPFSRGGEGKREVRSALLRGT